MSSASIGSQLFLLIILILINALFAAAEIAIVSQSESKLRKQADSGDRKAGRILKMVTQPAGFLSAIQICITLAGFLASAFTAVSFSSKLVRWLVTDCGIESIPGSTLETFVIVAIIIVLSFFMLVFGELVPKRIAMKHSEAAARFLNSIIIAASFIFKPFIWLTTVCANGVLRLFKINPKDSDESVSEEEIIMMLDIGEENGTIEANEKELIENVFAFNDVTAADVMVHRTRTTVIWLDNTPEEILEIITENGYSRHPVCDDSIDDVVGILYTREYLLAIQNNRQCDLKELLHPVKFVPETTHAHDLLKEMQRDRIHMAMVVDEFGGVAGIVTMEDILEEIVGEIWDESDEVVEELLPTGDNTYKVICSMELEDLFTHFSFEPDEESDSISVSGWVTEQFSRIPEEGEQFDYENLTVEVIKTDHKQVLEIKITVRESADASGDDTQ